MANECAGPQGTGLWVQFQIVPDKGPIVQHKGSLKIDDHDDAAGDITGRRILGAKEDELEGGKCKKGIDGKSTVVYFKVIMDNVEYFCSGGISKVSTTTFLHGAYRVTKVVGPIVTSPDEGDTGTWGGQQGN